MSKSHPVFVPNDTMGSRRETAILLVGTAQEYGIDQQDIMSAPTHGGFFITDRLAEVAFAEDDEPEAQPEPDVKTAKKSSRTTTKTSGNRAAKTGTEQE